MNALMFENASPVRSIAFKIAALLDFEQAGRPGVRHVGQQLEPLVTQPGDAIRRLVEGDAQIGVGAEGRVCMRRAPGSE